MLVMWNQPIHSQVDQKALNWASQVNQEARNIDESLGIAITYVTKLPMCIIARWLTAGNYLPPKDNVKDSLWQQHYTNASKT